VSDSAVITSLPAMGSRTCCPQTVPLLTPLDYQSHDGEDGGNVFISLFQSKPKGLSKFLTTPLLSRYNRVAWLYLSELFIGEGNSKHRDSGVGGLYQEDPSIRR